MPPFHLVPGWTGRLEGFGTGGLSFVLQNPASSHGWCPASGGVSVSCKPERGSHYTRARAPAPGNGGHECWQTQPSLIKPKFFLPEATFPNHTVPLTQRFIEGPHIDFSKIKLKNDLLSLLCFFFFFHSVFHSTWQTKHRDLLLRLYRKSINGLSNRGNLALWWLSGLLNSFLRLCVHLNSLNYVVCRA